MNKTALFLSPHFDDEVLLGGGTIQVLKSNGWNIVDVGFTGSEESGVTVSKTWQSIKEVQRILKIDEVMKLNFLDMHVEEESGRLIKRIIEMVRKYEPDVVFTTCKDFHIDHRALAKYSPEAIYQASRLGICGATRTYKEPLLLLGKVDMEYPVKMKSNVFVELTKEQVDKKVEALQCFNYLKDAHPATLEIFSEEHSQAWIYSTTRLAGIEVGVKYAEIFEIGNLRPMVNLTNLI